MLASTSPTIAVVVATHQRPKLLARCLEALVSQRRPADEVVVVGSGSETLAVLDRWRHLLQLRVVPHGPGGPAEARNDGWRASDAEYIAITDDDCRPDAGWLEALALEARPNVVAVGRVEVDPEDGPMTSVFDRSFAAGESDSARYSTANILYPREVLARTGGFDTSLVFWGEDTDLGMRAADSGAQRAYVNSAVVYHAVHRRGVLPTLNERWRSGWVVGLVRRHPSLRRSAFDGWFWSRQHRLLALSLLGLPLLVFTPLALLAPAPWIRYSRHRVNYFLGSLPRSPLGWVRHLSGLLLLDSVEFASCLWHSLRERTVFL